jgi:hypothetical protein
MKQTFLVILLLIIFAVSAISGMLQKSGTCDEIAHHIPAGYSYYKKWDFRLNPSNPPLSRYIMALPLLFLDLKAPFDDKTWQEADSPAFGKKFFFEYNRAKARTIIFLSRLSMVVMGILTGILVYFISAQFYGKGAGIFALFLYCFSPEILAHSSLATTDITFTFFTLFALYGFWRFVKFSNTPRLIISAITLGLAQLSKYTAVMLYPIYLLLIAIEFVIKRKIELKLLNKAMLIFLLSIIVIWAGYGFRMKPFLAETTRQEEKISFVQNAGSKFLPFWNEKLSEKTEYLLRNTSFPLSTYITGLFGVMKHSEEGHRTFFMGKWSDSGTPLYYLVAFLIKTPIPIIIFLIIALITLLRKGLRKDELYLIIPALVIFITASMSKLQLGIRYILPVYPLLFIFCSRIIAFVNRSWQRIGLGVLAAWLVFANILIWPDYLSYFNEIIGGPDYGWKYLRDSNIDWGQDLPALAKYMKKNNIGEVVLEYFGQDNPAVYGINFRKFDKDEFIRPRDSVYALSATYLEHALWLKNQKPNAKVGKSIFIYDLRSP